MKTLANNLGLVLCVFHNTNNMLCCITQCCNHTVGVITLACKYHTHCLYFVLPSIEYSLLTYLHCDLLASRLLTCFSSKQRLLKTRRPPVSRTHIYIYIYIHTCVYSKTIRHHSETWFLRVWSFEKPRGWEIRRIVFVCEKQYFIHGALVFVGFCQCPFLLGFLVALPLPLPLPLPLTPFSLSSCVSSTALPLPFPLPSILCLSLSLFFCLWNCFACPSPPLLFLLLSLKLSPCPLSVYLSPNSPSLLYYMGLY